MTPPEAIDLAALRAHAEKATPGRWYRDASNYRNLWSDEGPLFYTDGDRVFAEADADADYIVAVQPRAVLALLDRLAAAEAVVEAAKCACGYLRDRQFDLPEAIAAYDRAIAGQQRQQRQEGTT